MKSVRVWHRSTPPVRNLFSERNHSAGVGGVICRADSKKSRQTHKARIYVCNASDILCYWIPTRPLAEKRFYKNFSNCGFADRLTSPTGRGGSKGVFKFSPCYIFRPSQP